MYLSIIPEARTGKRRLYIRESFRENGKIKQRIIKNLGYAEDYTNQFEDPIAHFKDEVALRNKEAKEKNKEIILKIKLNNELEKHSLESESDFSNRKNMGSIVISYFYNKLKIPQFINSKKRSTDVTFNMNNIVKLLIFSRILKPGSKYDNFQNKELYFEKTNCILQHIYRTMDYLIEWKDDLLNHLNKQMEKEFHRDSTLMFYDVTNYYFEIDYSDEKEGPNEGFRRNGVSKEHRPNPIVQMGLFMDDMGLPVSYQTFNGNVNDCNTLQPNMETVSKDLNIKNIIVVADKGMMTGDNIGNIIVNHNGYVISHTIRGADKELKDWVLKQDDYTFIDVPEKQQRYERIKKGRHAAEACSGRMKIKSRIHPVKVNVKNKITGKIQKVTINERQIIYYSQKYADKAKKERKEAIRKAQEFVMSGSTSVINHHGKMDLVESEVVDTDGEILNKRKCIKTRFNKKKLEEAEALDGYYVVCSNVIGLDKNEESMHCKSKFVEGNFFKLNKTVTDMDIIEIYRGLWEIEETFKITKSNLEVRPIYHSRKDRIESHFLTCFISLLILRLIEQLVESKWSTNQIIESMQKANGTKEGANLYLFDYYDDVLEEFDKKLGTQFKRERLTSGEIKKIIGSLKK